MYGFCFCHTKNPEQRRAQHILLRIIIIILEPVWNDVFLFHRLPQIDASDIAKTFSFDDELQNSLVLWQAVGLGVRRRMWGPA
jgi:hypothetical protein